MSLTKGSKSPPNDYKVWHQLPSDFKRNPPYKSFERFMNMDITPSGKHRIEWHFAFYSRKLRGFAIRVNIYLSTNGPHDEHLSFRDQTNWAKPIESYWLEPDGTLRPASHQNGGYSK
jgi:hypothetical protein